MSIISTDMVVRTYSLVATFWALRATGSLTLELCMEACANFAPSALSFSMFACHASMSRKGLGQLSTSIPITVSCSFNSSAAKLSPSASTGCVSPLPEDASAGCASPLSPGVVADVAAGGSSSLWLLSPSVSDASCRANMGIRLAGPCKVVLTPATSGIKWALSSRGSGTADCGSLSTSVCSILVLANAGHTCALWCTRLR